MYRCGFFVVTVFVGHSPTAWTSNPPQQAVFRRFPYLEALWFPANGIHILAAKSLKFSKDTASNLRVQCKISSLVIVRVLILHPLWCSRLPPERSKSRHDGCVAEVKILPESIMCRVFLTRCRRRLSLRLKTGTLNKGNL